MVVGYSLPGYFKEYQIEAATLDMAKQVIRERLGVRRLPSGIKIWDASVRPVVQWRPIPLSSPAWVV